MSRKYNDSKLQLGPPYAEMVMDFLAANYNGFAIDLIREAVKEHIERRLKSPEMRTRYEEARRLRLGQSPPIVRLATNNPGEPTPKG